MTSADDTGSVDALHLVFSSRGDVPQPEVPPEAVLATDLDTCARRERLACDVLMLAIYACDTHAATKAATRTGATKRIMKARGLPMTRATEQRGEDEEYAAWKRRESELALEKLHAECEYHIAKCATERAAHLV